MIAQILQNLARPSHLAQPNSRETPFLTHDDNENLIRTAFRGIKRKLAEAREQKVRETRIRVAIEHLHGLTDEQLRDMGIGRMDIAHVVRYGRD